MEYVLKTARNEHNNIVWQAVYAHGVKQLENKLLDVAAVKRALDITADLTPVDIVELDSDHYEAAFPATDDFSYLLDYTPIFEGKEVYLEEGKRRVVSIETGYRPAGHYAITEWQYRGDKLRSRRVKTFYTGHEVTYFTVEGSADRYIWEDYNYQQSFLHEFIG